MLQTRFFCGRSMVDNFFASFFLDQKKKKPDLFDLNQMFFFFIFFFFILFIFISMDIFFIPTAYTPVSQPK